MRTRPDLPSREPWEVHSPVLEWTDLSPEDAHAHIMGGASLLLEGPAGSGKSHWARACLQELSKSKSCVLLAKTHVAANNMSAPPKLIGQTCDSWTRRHIMHGGFAGGCIWLDEWTTLDMQQYTLLRFLRYNDSTQCTVSGNCAQMGACFSNFRGVDVDADQIGQSELFFNSCGGHRCISTTYHRADVPLYNWYTSLGDGGSRAGLSLAEQVRQAKADFPRRDHARWHLVVSHLRRKQINRREMLRLKPADAVFYPMVCAPGTTCEPQDMCLWTGSGCYACCRATTKGLRNGMLYKVEIVGDTTVLEGGISLNKEEVSKHLRPSFAQTYAGSQAVTLHSRVELCDTESPRFTSRMLLMGLSRATAFDLVQIG